MSKRIQRRSRSTNHVHDGHHRFEHWLIDNQVYFITARCRDRFPAFAHDNAKTIFWEQFEKYAAHFGFALWVVSLLDNHYHALGSLAEGKNLPTMMQRIHGSVAKRVNDTLPERLHEFWRDAKGREYFDGCLRDEKQGRLTYRYILAQGQRHGIVHHSSDYRHTRVYVTLEDAIARARELKLFLGGVPYKRYAQSRSPAR